MTTKFLNREQYLQSVMKMNHFQSLQFAKQSLDRWDDYFSWVKSPCLCLVDNDGLDVCYLFYYVSKDNKYLTIENILTPYPSRFNGYAKKMLTILFNTILLNSKIQRVKMYCVSSSLQFYMNLGIDFWGVNKIGQYYADFPMPKCDICEIKLLMSNEHFQTVSQDDRNVIYNNLKENGSLFDIKEKKIFDKSLLLLKKRYRFGELYDIVNI